MLGVFRTKRKLFSSLNYNKLLHTLETYTLSWSSDNIDRDSYGVITCLVIFKELTPTKGKLIIQLKPENYRREFCHQLNVFLFRYQNDFFVTNDFDKNKYFQSLRNSHLSCDVNVHDKCNFCKDDIKNEYAFERNSLTDEDTCCCQSIFPFCVKWLKN